MYSQRCTKEAYLPLQTPFNAFRIGRAERGEGIQDSTKQTRNKQSFKEYLLTFFSLCESMIQTITTNDSNDSMYHVTISLL